MATVPPPQDILWNRSSPPPPDCGRLEGEMTADVAIVGAGLTGLRAAVTLAEAGVETVVLDAERIGFGASGRSGGQCNPMWRATPDDLVRKYGAAQAERLIETTLSAADDLFDDIRRYDIDCGAEQNGWIQAAHTRRAARKLERLRDGWQAVGAQIDTLSGPEVHEAAGSPAYEFALLHHKGGFVHPLALTRGFAKTAQRHGAWLFEESPVTGMERGGGKWRVQTPDGVVTCDTVILSTNAYTDGLWPGLRQTVVPMVSIILATAPLTPEQQAVTLPGRRTIADTRLAIFYSRYDAENRLVFGCIGSADDVGAWGGHGRLASALTTVFPHLSDTPVECTWSGRIAVTPDMMPRLHAPAPGVLAGLGYSGRGIAMTSVMGRALASKVLGGRNSELPFPVSAIQPIPLQALSRRMVSVMAPMMSLRDRLAVAWDRIGAGQRK